MKTNLSIKERPSKQKRTIKAELPTAKTWKPKNTFIKIGGKEIF